MDEEEAGLGPTHFVTYTPGAGAQASFEKLTVPEGRFFVMGDSRDNSEDSRTYGSIARESIRGKVRRLSGAPAGEERNR